MREDIPFSQIIYQWMAEHSSQITLSSAAKYYQLANNHIISFFQNVKCEEVTQSLLNNYADLIKSQCSEHRLSNGNLRTVFMILNRSLEYGYTKRFFEQKFYIKPQLAKQKPLVRVFSTEEQTKIERYLLDHPTRNSLAILLALYSGIRIGELCALRWSDIDFENASVTVTKTVQRLKQPSQAGTQKTKLILSQPKSSASYRIIPIPQFLVSYMRDFYTNDKENFYLLGNQENFPMDPRVLQYAYKKILQQISVPYLNFHCLRHTFATRCVTIGWDMKTLSEVLGHSEIKITMDYYFHSSFEHKRAQMNKLFLLSQN